MRILGSWILDNWEFTVLFLNVTYCNEAKYDRIEKNNKKSKIYMIHIFKQYKKEMLQWKKYNQCSYYSWNCSNSFLLWSLRIHQYHYNCPS